MQSIVRYIKAIVYAWLAIIIGCNVYGVESVFGFIPNITFASNNGELRFYLDGEILKFTFYLAVLEAIDNYHAIRIKRIKI